MYAFKFKLNRYMKQKKLCERTTRWRATHTSKSVCNHGAIGDAQTRNATRLLDDDQQITYFCYIFCNLYVLCVFVLLIYNLSCKKSAFAPLYSMWFLFSRTKLRV